MASKPTKDYYEILGATKTSPESEIKAKYKKLALKYHPDKNPDDNEAAARFAEISAAYAVLSDPNKRRVYDLSGEDGGTGMEYETLDVSTLGFGGRAFGALFSKMGIQIQTAIGQSTLEEARRVCESADSIRAKASRLTVNAPAVNIKVEKQTAQFFYVEISEAQAQMGFAVRCTSQKESKYKLIYFDKGGAVRFQEESDKYAHDKKRGTVADMFFLSFPNMHLARPPVLMFSDDDMPPLFRKLDNLEPSRYQGVLGAGLHVFAVYGDNWFNKVQLAIEIRQCTTDSPMVKRIQDLERDLVDRKQDLEKFQKEFLDARAAFMEAQKKYMEKDKELEELIASREMAYQDYANGPTRPK